jgi:uncharacterized protein (TIRG00374 family)
MSTPKRSSSRFWTLVRSVVGVVLALFLVHRVVAQANINLADEFRTCIPGWLVLALALMLVGLGLSSYRWLQLLRVQSILISRWDCLCLTMIGTFFNMLIPGGVGGDVVKMAYIRKLVGPKAPEAIVSILVDRILGLLGLFSTAIVAVLLTLNFLRHVSHDLKVVVATVTCIAGCGALAMALAAGHDLVVRLPGIRHLVEAVGPRLPGPIRHIIARVVGAMNVYRRAGGTILWALVVSMCIHTLTALAVFCIGVAFHATRITFPIYVLATSMANTISAIPLTPGGIGPRDVVMRAFFEAAGEGSRASVIPPVFSMVFLVMGLIGGLFLLYESKHNPLPPEA